jgi:hypothetical protein
MIIIIEIFHCLLINLFIATILESIAETEILGTDLNVDLSQLSNVIYLQEKAEAADPETDFTILASR